MYKFEYLIIYICIYIHIMIIFVCKLTCNKKNDNYKVTVYLESPGTKDRR